MRLRVRFAETDAMGVAHHGAYVDWLEAARVAWLREAGLDYRDLVAHGVHLAVSAVQLRYRAAAAFDDELEVRCRLVELRTRRVVFDYELMRLADGHAVAQGRTEHVPTGHDGRAVRLPRTWLDALRPFHDATE